LKKISQKDKWNERGKCKIQGNQNHQASDGINVDLKQDCRGGRELHKKKMEAIQMWGDDVGEQVGEQEPEKKEKAALKKAIEGGRKKRVK